MQVCLVSMSIFFLLLLAMLCNSRRQSLFKGKILEVTRETLIL